MLYLLGPNGVRGQRGERQFRGVEEAFCRIGIASFVVWHPGWGGIFEAQESRGTCLYSNCAFQWIASIRPEQHCSIVCSCGSTVLICIVLYMYLRVDVWLWC